MFGYYTARALLILITPIVRLIANITAGRLLVYFYVQKLDDLEDPPHGVCQDKDCPYCDNAGEIAEA